VETGYAIAEVTSVLLIVGFLFSKIDPFYESLFFVGLITFFLTYMLALIKDLDDPFGYGPQGGGADEVSLVPLAELSARLKRRGESLASQ
jgi:predicted membrane chloride channel (bestrophin family)